MPKFNNKHHDEYNNLDKFDVDDFNIDDIDFDDIEDIEDDEEDEEDNIDFDDIENDENFNNEDDGIDFNDSIEDNKNIEDDFQLENLSKIDSSLEKKIDNTEDIIDKTNNINNIVENNLLKNDDISYIDESKLKNINFKINIEAGSVDLSLEELANLKHGDILDFAGLPPKVKLVLNGSFLAEGYLVEFNGRLGVKLIRLINKEF